MTFDDFVEAADYAVIEDCYRRAARVISPALATTYSEHLADQNDDAEDYEEALIEAHIEVAALGLVDTIETELESEAEALAREWLTNHEANIKGLTDERQSVYRELRALSADPLDVTIAIPKNRLQHSVELLSDGTKAPLPSLDRHLLCDEDGMYPDFLNEWEAKVLEVEMSSETSLAWYRNPSSSTPESLGIIYENDGQASVLRPDFIFFKRESDGTIQADLVDPHGHHLADSLPKLLGLKDYAERYGAEYNRIEAVAEIKGGLCSLDIKDAAVRDALASASSAKSLFEGEHSKPYPRES